MYIYTYMCVYIYIYVCVCMYRYTYVCVYIYTYIHYDCIYIYNKCIHVGCGGTASWAGPSREPTYIRT